MKKTPVGETNRGGVNMIRPPGLFGLTLLGYTIRFTAGRPQNRIVN